MDLASVIQQNVKILVNIMQISYYIVGIQKNRTTLFGCFVLYFVESILGKGDFSSFFNSGILFI